jgi:hypothetical protein
MGMSMLTGATGSPSRSSRVRRALGGATAFALVAAVWGPACADRSCDPGPIPIYGTKPGEGILTSEDTWESTPVDADWLEYGSFSGWNIVVGRWADENRPLVEMHAYVSESKHPATEGNYAEASGNSAEFSHAVPGHVWGYNATCARFFVRFVLRAGRPLVDAGPLFPDDSADASDASDAGVSSDASDAAKE